MTLFDTGSLLAVPPTTPTCPACGGENNRRHPRDPRCERCARVGVEAPTLLSLGAGTIHTPAEIEHDQEPDEIAAELAANRAQADARPVPRVEHLAKCAAPYIGVATDGRYPGVCWTCGWHDGITAAAYRDATPPPFPCPARLGLGWACQLDEHHEGPCGWPAAALVNNDPENPDPDDSDDSDDQEPDEIEPEPIEEPEPEPVAWPPADPVAHACTFLAPWVVERVTGAETTAEAIEHLRQIEGIGYHGASTRAGAYQAETTGATIRPHYGAAESIRLTWRQIAEHLRAGAALF